MNNRISLTVTFLLSLHLSFPSLAQHPGIDPHWMHYTWDAKWITYITGKFSPEFDGIYLFNKEFSLEHTTTDPFLVHVSGDNRYELFINGTLLGTGPARSVVDHWNFETYDLAPYLRQGSNRISAIVWNWGQQAPWAQASLRTAFILQGNGPGEAVVNTNRSWKVKKQTGHTFFDLGPGEFMHTIGAGPCEAIDAAAYDWEWMEASTAHPEWLPAEEIHRGNPAGPKTRKYTWGLTPRSIPQMEHNEIRLHRVVRTHGAEVSGNFCAGKGLVTIPANTSAKVLLDNRTLTVAYPRLTVSRGKGATIKATYCEALYDAHKNKKERYITDGMNAMGYVDLFYPDGKTRTFRPLWNRTFRFIELDIKTGNDQLLINDLTGISAIYPFTLKASFSCSDPVLDSIFSIGWRTGRMCALENYVDCPYYEQLQYFGDLNISNPVTLMLSGDARLVKSAILQGKYSITEEGLTLCAAPTKNAGGKIIPFFSIAWIGMIHNYFMATADLEFTKSLFPEILGVLDWYRQRINEKGLLGPMTHWNFVDCTDEWPWDPANGVVCEPPGTKAGNSAILTLQYVYGLQTAADLMMHAGLEKEAAELQEEAGRINRAVYDNCWDTGRELLADVPEKTSFSEHANIFGLLTGAIPEDAAIRIIRDFESTGELIPASTQFLAYFHKALQKYGMESLYLDRLDPWRQMVAWGFTTFPEYPELNNRSDCHAWNAFPAYELLTIVCGIRQIEPGFRKVVIEPHPGNLQWFTGSLPVGEGTIGVDLEHSGKQLKGTVTIPKGVEATFRWNGTEHSLKEGINKIKSSRP